MFHIREWSKQANIVADILAKAPKIAKTLRVGKEEFQRRQKLVYERLKEAGFDGGIVYSDEHYHGDVPYLGGNTNISVEPVSGIVGKNGFAILAGLEGCYVAEQLSGRSGCRVGRVEMLKLADEEYPVDTDRMEDVIEDICGGKPGDMPVLLRFLRDKKVTRVMIPNHYHEHTDHRATYLMSSYDVPQAGDAALVDHGTPHKVLSTLQYSVWADFDPENSLVAGRTGGLRANRILAVSADVEKEIDYAIEAYVSQDKIIEELVNSRRERETKDGRFVEPYIIFDCRPKINLKPYVDFVENH